MFSRCITEFWCCQMDALAGRIHLNLKGKDLESGLLSTEEADGLSLPEPQTG